MGPSLGSAPLGSAMVVVACCSAPPSPSRKPSSPDIAMGQIECDVFDIECKIRKHAKSASETHAFGEREDKGEGMKQLTVKSQRTGRGG